MPEIRADGSEAEYSIVPEYTRGETSESARDYELSRLASIGVSDAKRDLARVLADAAPLLLQVNGEVMEALSLEDEASIVAAMRQLAADGVDTRIMEIIQDATDALTLARRMAPDVAGRFRHGGGKTDTHPSTDGMELMSYQEKLAAVDASRETRAEERARRAMDTTPGEYLAWDAAGAKRPI